MVVIAQRDLFVAAVNGDLDTMRHFFLQARVISDGDNPSPLGSVSYPGNWFRYTLLEPCDLLLRGSLFDLIIQHDQLGVLQWLHSSAVSECLEMSVLEVVFRVRLKAILEGRAAVLAILLDSYTFKKILTPASRENALSDMLNEAFTAIRVDLLRLVIAHGADVAKAFSNRPIPTARGSGRQRPHPASPHQAQATQEEEATGFLRGSTAVSRHAGHQALASPAT